MRHGLRPCAASRRRPASPCAATPPPPDRSACASEYCAVPAAPSISATAAECKVENFDCRPVEGSTTPVMDRTSGCTRSAISSTAAGSIVVSVADRDHRVDQRMQHHAAGVRLVAVALDQPAVAEALGQVLRLGGVAVDARKALLAFDDLLRRIRSRARRAAPPARRCSRPCRRAATCTWCRGSAACRQPGSPRSPSRRSAAGRRGSSSLPPATPAAMLPSVPVRCQPPLWWPGAVRPERTPASKPVA